MAVVGYPHHLKGQGVSPLAPLMQDLQPNVALRQELADLVGREICHFARPEPIQ